MQMISDEERREVAARLAREAKAWSDTFPDEICDLGDASAVMQDLCVFAGLRGKVTCGDIFLRFAELIDRPMTHVDVNKHGRACCANCGCDDWCLADDNAHFCPQCGAEVVHE